MTRVLALALIAVCALPATASARIVYGDLSELYSVAPNGGAPRKITEQWYGTELSAMPTGRTLVTPGAAERLSIISASTGEEVDSVNLAGKTWVGGVDWAPSGPAFALHACDRTVFTDIEECVRYGIYRGHRGGPGPRHLERVAEGSYPSWSRDGHSLTFMHRVRPHDSDGNECNGIYVARVDGRGLRRVLPRRRRCAFPGEANLRPVFGAGDHRIIFTREGGVWSVRLDGRGLRKLVDASHGYMAVAAQVAPDGRRIVYVLRDRRRRGFGVYVARADGSRARRVATTRYPNALAWLPLASR